MSLRFVPTPIPGRVANGELVAARDAQASRRVPAGTGPAFLARGAAGAGLDALLSGRALAVTTGQQAGLFTGPLYTVTKAVTAAALARWLEAAWGRPVVPVFWVAGDDHDFAEIAACHVLARDGERASVVLRERAPDAPMLPAFREPLGSEVTAALGRLEELLPAGEFRPGVLDWLRGAYRPERSMAEAHAEALADLLADHGVVVLRGWHAALKEGTADVLMAALGRAAGLDRALAEESAALRAGGGDAPVEVGTGLALVMLEGASGRDRLKITGESTFVTRRSAEPFTLSALERILREAPERLSANVLLRPVVEARALPTVAYVGGPGELAYLAQTGPLFRELDVPRPVPVPRLSGLLVDSRTAGVLERFGLSPGDLAGADQEVARGVLRDALPASAVAALEWLQRALAEGYAALAGEAAAVDSTLERPVESARNQALSALRGIEKRLVAALKRTNETSVRQLSRAREALFPGNEAQERVFTLASFSARFGPEVMAVLAAGGQDHVARLLEANPRQV